jgi:hypothetical protein
MNAEIWRSEIVTYGFMILNMFAVATGLVWAWRRGLFSDLDGTMRSALDLPPDSASSKENGNV